MLPPTKEQIRKVQRCYLHPIIFPKSYSEPDRINKYYQRLHAISEEINLWEIPEDQLVGERKRKKKDVREADEELQLPNKIEEPIQ